MVQPKLYLNENRGAMRQRFSPDVIVEYCRDRKKQEGIHRSLVGEQSLGLIFCRRLAGRNLSEQPCTDFVGKGKRVFAALDLDTADAHRDDADLVHSPDGFRAGPCHCLLVDSAQSKRDVGDLSYPDEIRRNKQEVRCFLGQDDDPSRRRRLASGWRGDQSLGGNATRQKVGLGSRNSTPTFTGSFGNRSMWATTHSSESLVCGFVSVRRWPR